MQGYVRRWTFPILFFLLIVLYLNFSYFVQPMHIAPFGMEFFFFNLILEFFRFNILNNAAVLWFFFFFFNVTFNIALQCGIQPQQGSNEQKEILPYKESSPSSDVETELFIGLPEGRAKRSRLLQNWWS